MQWLARSGVELARYTIASNSIFPTHQYDSLNQLWAGRRIDETNDLARFHQAQGCRDG